MVLLPSRHGILVGSQKRGLRNNVGCCPPFSFDRLWLNKWLAGGSDAFDEADVNAIFRDDLLPMSGAAHERELWNYVGGVDLGISRDFSAACILAVGRPDTPHQDVIRLADHQIWKPLPGEKIDLQSVEDWLLEKEEQFGLEAIGHDGFQAEHLGQRIELALKAPSVPAASDIVAFTIVTMSKRFLQRERICSNRQRF